MAMTTLICPHCGGIFELDDERGLQPFWVCPYCGNRSLMQKTADAIRLRGIISSQPAAPAVKQSLEAIDENEESAAEETESQDEPDKPDRTVATGEQSGWPLPKAVAESETKPDQAEISKEKPVAPSTPTIPAAEEVNPDHYYLLAKEAANQHDLPLFNTYSRLALDSRPTDPRIYALRAVLNEEAGGFARATWASPSWVLLSPRSWQAALAQQLYNYNTALKYYSSFEQRQELTQSIARLLVRQLTDQFTEQAELRCRRTLFHKKFKGRYHRADLVAAGYFTSALNQLNETVSPLGHLDLLAALRVEIQNLPPRLARRLNQV